MFTFALRIISDAFASHGNGLLGQRIQFTPSGSVNIIVCADSLGVLGLDSEDLGISEELERCLSQIWTYK